MSPILRVGLTFFVFFCVTDSDSLSFVDFSHAFCLFTSVNDSDVVVCERCQKLYCVEATRHRATDFSWEDYRQSLYFNSDDADKPGLSHPCLDHHLGPPKLGTPQSQSASRRYPTLPAHCSYTQLQTLLHLLTYLSRRVLIFDDTLCSVSEQTTWLASCSCSRLV